MGFELRTLVLISLSTDNDTNVPDRDAHQLHQENLMLKAENERLHRESKNRIAALQREVLHLANELNTVRRPPQSCLRTPLG